MRAALATACVVAAASLGGGAAAMPAGLSESAVATYRALEPMCPATGFRQSREVELATGLIAEMRESVAGDAMATAFDEAQQQVAAEIAVREHDCPQRTASEDAAALDAQVLALDEALVRLDLIIPYGQQEG